MNPNRRALLKVFAIAATFTLLFWMVWYMLAVNLPGPIQGIVMVTAAILIAFAALKVVHPSNTLSGGVPSDQPKGGLSTKMSIILLILFVATIFLVPLFITFLRGR